MLLQGIILAHYAGNGFPNRALSLLRVAEFAYQLRDDFIDHFLFGKSGLTRGLWRLWLQNVIEVCFGSMRLVHLIC
jgi:hypothetical protein